MLVHAGALANGFAWDDGYLVRDNPSVHSFSHLLDWFTRPWAAGAQAGRAVRWNALYWRPLAQLSYAVDWTLGGGAPWAFHLTNLLLHALCTALVAALAARVARAAWRWRSRAGHVAWIAGLLYAVHPVHTEVVYLATYRTTLLATMGTLAALWWHGRAGLAARAGFALSLAAGLLSKESAAVAPALMALLDRGGVADARRGSRAMWGDYAVAVALLAAWLLVRRQLVAAPYLSFFAGATPPEIAWTMATVFLLDLRLLVVAWPLTSFYDWTLVPLRSSPLDPAVAAGLAAIGLFVALTAWAWVRRRTAWLASGAFFVVALLPYAHIVPFFDVAGERFLYLASAGFAVGVALVAIAAEQRLASRPQRAALAAVLASVLVVFAARSASRARDFASTEAMLRAAVREVPRSFHAHFELGRLYARQGRLTAAAAELKQAWERMPALPQAAIAYAEVLVRLGERDRATQVLERARRLAPASLRGELDAALHRLRGAASP